MPPALAAPVFQTVEAAPSLKGVIGSVVLAPGRNDDLAAAGLVPAANVLAVDGSVSTTATALGPARIAPATAAPTVAAAPAIRAPNGTWDYHESTSTDLASMPAPEQPKGSRVLRGAVYRITRADGGVEYTNIPQAGGGQKGQSIKMLFTYIATCAACDVHSKIDWNSVALNISSYGDAISSASSEFGVDEALLRAVIHAESAFNPRALSVAGAQGLMQLIPGTARDMGVLDAFDANQNIRGGARYLALLLRNFNGNERLAAAAYNAGPGAVQKYNGVPPYDETQVYVERVGVLRKRYGETLKQHASANVPLASAR
jgi:soluble lytic murein transglycosylase-like protein